MNCLGLVSLLCAWGLCASPPAWSADASEAISSPAPKKAKGKKKSGARLMVSGGSGESPAERSARLRRECRGRPNAGACTGHTD